MSKVCANCWGDLSDSDIFYKLTLTKSTPYILNGFCVIDADGNYIRNNENVLDVPICKDCADACLRTFETDEEDIHG